MDAVSATNREHPKSNKKMKARNWLLMSISVIAEVTASLCLKASEDDPRWFALVALGFTLACACFVVLIGTGVALGVAIAIWAGSGVVLTALLAAVIYDESFGLLTGTGLTLIIIGIAAIQYGSVPNSGQASGMASEPVMNTPSPSSAQGREP